MYGTECATITTGESHQLHDCCGDRDMLKCEPPSSCKYVCKLFAMVNRCTSGQQGWSKSQWLQHAEWPWVVGGQHDPSLLLLPVDKTVVCE